jgi:hypothetical protein
VMVLVAVRAVVTNRVKATTLVARLQSPPPRRYYELYNTTRCTINLASFCVSTMIDKRVHRVIKLVINVTPIALCSSLTQTQCACVQSVAHMLL